LSYIFGCSAFFIYSLPFPSLSASSSLSPFNFFYFFRFLPFPSVFASGSLSSPFQLSPALSTFALANVVLRPLDTVSEISDEVSRETKTRVPGTPGEYRSGSIDD
jgi:hypothetical protein